jgi:hypothetical protein
MVSIGAFDAKQCAPVASIKARLTTIDCPIRWGQYARHHIGDALKKGIINMDDQALTTMTVEITAAAEATAVGE